MGVGNLLILAQVTLYLLTFIFSFFIFIPLTVNVNEFNGHCLLFATGKWGRTNESIYAVTIDNWGNSGNCNFPIFAGVISFPMSLFYILWMGVYLFKGTEPSWLSAFVVLITSSVMVVVTFISAVILSSGYNSWCRLLDIGTGCAGATYDGLDKYKDINTHNFATEFGMAQFGIWGSVLCWVCLLGLGSWQLYQYHRQEDFITSFYRERERLLQRVGTSHATGYSI